MSESQFYHIRRAGKLACKASVAEALASAEEGGYLWLDFCEPTKEELTALIEPLGIDPLSVEDCLDENQIPKIEDYPRNTFLLFNAFSYVDKTLSIHEVDAIIGENFLITVSRRDTAGRRILAGIERTCELDIEDTRQGPAFLLHVILDRVVDQKFLTIEGLEETIDTAEEALMDDLPRFNPTELLHLRRDLFAVRKSLFHEREILVRVCRKDCPFIAERAIYFYRDIYDHLTKFFELTESSREVVTSLMEMYLSMLNNQMTKVANETNLIVRRLTLITTVFMPLTLLAGIGGMSEWSMMTGPENWRIAYPVFLLAMALIGVFNYYVLKRFERKDYRRTQLVAEQAA